jgi:DNA modification methylase
MKSFIEGVFSKTPLNISDIPQEELNIANKFRSNPLPWKGQFSPQLIEVLLSKYAPNAQHILDPFLGSGTTLLEAATLGLEATGVELNPAAVVLARTYEFCNLHPENRDEIMRIVSKSLNGCKTLIQPFLNHEISSASPENIKQSLLGIHGLMNGNTLPKRLLETLIVLLDFYRDDLSPAKVQTEWKKLKNLLSVLPFSAKKITALQTDARLIPLNSNVVDFVITSPPYINVFNYHQQYRASVEALEHSILKVAQSEIGSNRKHRGNRYLTVIQYCIDMALVLGELKRICTNKAKLVFVVGRESSVRKTPFFNAEIVAEVAVKAAKLEMPLRQQRVFTNRFGQSIFEDILHFTVPFSTTNKDALLSDAREIALKALLAAKKVAPLDSLLDLNDAIDSIAIVEPSPYFDNILYQKERAA